MSSLLRFHDTSTKPRYRVFLFPFAGGNAVFYHPWSAIFPEDIDVVAIQLPGRGNRLQENCLRRMSDITTMLLEEIETDLDLPYLFFGHSMGAALAYNLALAIRDEDFPMPEQLYLSGRRSPQLGQSLTPDRHKLTQQKLLEWAVSTGGFPKELLAYQDMVDMFMTPLSADLEALEVWQNHFRPSSPLFVPFTVFSGSEDPEVTWDEVKPWTELSGLKCHTHLFEGGHFYLKKEAPVIVEKMIQSLETIVG